MASEVDTIITAAPLLDVDSRLSPLAKSALCVRVADANLSLCLKREPVTLNVDGVPSGLRKDVQIHDWRLYATLASTEESLEDRIKTIHELLRIEDRREARSFLYKQLACQYKRLAAIPPRLDETSCPFMKLPEDLCAKIAAGLTDPEDRANFASCNTATRRAELLSRKHIRISGNADVRNIKRMLKASPSAEMLTSESPLKSSLVSTLIRQSTDKLTDFGECPIEVSSWKNISSLLRRATAVSLVVDASCLAEAPLQKHIKKTDRFDAVTSLQLRQVGPPQEETSPEAFAHLLSCLPALTNLRMSDLRLTHGHFRALSTCPALASLTIEHSSTAHPNEAIENLEDFPLRELEVYNSRDCSLMPVTVRDIVCASRKTLERLVYHQCQYQSTQYTMSTHALIDLEINRWNDLWYMRFDDRLPRLKRLTLRSDCQLSMELPYTFDELETLRLGSDVTTRLFDLCGCVAYIAMYRVSKFPSLKLIEAHLDMQTASSHALAQIARQLGKSIQLHIV